MAQKMNVLVVGAGSIGERHARCFGSTGRVDVSLCDVDSKKCREVAERCQVSQSFVSWDDALASDPAAIVIATPADFHIPMARNAVLNGCHVLITGVAELQDLVAERGAFVSVAYVLRCHPTLAAMRSVLHSGRFGKPLQAVLVAGQHFPFYRPAYRQTYYTRHDTGGGAIQDSLTHWINAVEWLVGPVDRLVGDAEHLALEGVTVEDTVQVLTRHGDVLGCFQLNQHQAPNESTLTVICERGTIRFETHNNGWRWMVEPGDVWHDEDVRVIERDAMFVAQANHFLDILEGQASPACTLAEAAQTLRVNLAILESVRSHSWQTISKTVVT